MSSGDESNAAAAAAAGLRKNNSNNNNNNDYDEAIDILEALRSEVAYLPGGKDRENRPIILIDIPVGEPSPITRANLDQLIRYFLSIFSDETKASGLTLLVDARSTTWRTARTHTRRAAQQLRRACSASTATVIALRPDGFWDNKRVDNCTKIHRDGEPVYVPLSRLGTYVDSHQLTYKLGGSKPYDHKIWIQNRLRIEEFMTDARSIVEKLREQRERLSPVESTSAKSLEQSLVASQRTSFETINTAQRILHAGRCLVSSMSRESAQDVLDTVQRIHKLIDSVEQKQLEIERARSDMERSIDVLKEIELLEVCVVDVTNWILGPADSMLNSQYQIGFDVASSEELRAQHEQLELECRETYGKYAEVSHKIDSIMPSFYISEDLRSQREFMDFVCRSFATRLERRRNVLITSQRFFRLVSEYFDKTSEVFDKLIMGSRSCDFSNAGSKLTKLERSQRKLENLEKELIREGEKLSDVLSMPVKDALCRDVRIDYAEDIINVKDILDATGARKNIFNDSVELQKLTLKQIALIHTYESEVEQAIKWLNELFEVLISNHVEIGCDVAEIQSQKQEHQNFQETARGTYEYGCQLTNGARVLRVSCKLELHDNAVLMTRLRQAWRQLRSVGQEQLTRLRVCAVFYRNVTDHCLKLREMIETVSAFSPKRVSRSVSVSPENNAASESAIVHGILKPRAEIRDVLSKREKLLPEVGRMVRLGRLLRSRLKEPLLHQRMPDGNIDESATSDKTTGDEGNLTAVQSISSKLLEVTRLAEKLDTRLCQAGARSRALNSNGSAGGGEDNTDLATATVDDVRDANVGTSPTIRELEDVPCGDDVVGLTDIVQFSTELVSKVPVDAQSRSSDRASIPDQDSTVDEYVTATEGSSTPVLPRSRSESFLSSEYEDALVSLACSPRIEYEQSTMLPEKYTPMNCDNQEPVYSNVQESMECPPSRATVLHRTIEEKDGTIIKEVTETTTLRVSHDTRFGVASYQLVSNELGKRNEYVNHLELEDLERTVTGNGDYCTSSSSSTTPTNLAEIVTNRDEHTYSMPNGRVNYLKSSGVLGNGRIIGSCYQTPRSNDGVRTVSAGEEIARFNATTKASRPLAAARVALAYGAAIPEELANLPTAIALCELN